MSTRRRPRIALTPGEPAGIGPDLTVALAGRPRDFDLVAVADPELLTGRAACLDTPLTAVPWAPGDVVPDTAGRLAVLPVPLAAPASPGRLDRTNAEYVLASLQRAGQGCLSGQFDALVTGPVHKGVINDAGVAFSGHTEFLAALTGSSQPVMMLTADTLRVALVTTHLPLRAVADSITAERLEWVCRILHADLRDRFHLPRPRILVAGLNPHAGEGGHLGHEEIEVITPVLQRLRSEGLDLRGPLPADTLFTPRQLATADAALAMYHDQGLPVLKHAGFGHAVNVTLGLPIIRTSVDHGTALELAGTGRADSGSLEAALAQALTLVTRAPA